MTFRTRLVLAATSATLIVLLLGSLATYLQARNSLVGSVDDTIQQQARNLITPNFGGDPPIGNSCTSTVGTCAQVIAANGIPVPADPTVLSSPEEATEIAASRGTGGTTFFNTTTEGVPVREVVTALPPGFSYRGNNGYEVLIDGGALQVTAPLAGVRHQLRHLFVVLWIIIVAGVALAIILGLVVGRTVLRPLDDLTASIEDLARTTDVSERLDPGGPDELGRLRRAFNHLLAALETSRDSQRQLVLDASHELRTPLTSLRTNMEVAARLDDLQPEDRSVLIGDVLTQLDELTQLVGGITELARGEQPVDVHKPLRFDLLVEESVAAAITHGRNRGVTYRTHLDPCWVVAAEGRLERAVNNLLDNALKWSPDNSVVEVSCTEGVLLVRDYGPGVPEEDMAHIFDRFYRANEARGKPGSGLGLAIVDQVVKDEGGGVAVANADGGGAIFRLWLPAVPEPPDAPAD